MQFIFRRKRKRPADSGVEGSNSRRRIEADNRRQEAKHVIACMIHFYFIIFSFLICTICRKTTFQHGRRDFSFKYVNCDYEASFFQHAEHNGDNGQTMMCVVQALNYYNEINVCSFHYSFFSYVKYLIVVPSSFSFIFLLLALLFFIGDKL